MPMKLNVGLSRKVGEPNYGSRGAIVNVGTKVDATLINEPQRLQERIREMFRLAQEAVDEELSTGSETASTKQPPTNGNGSANGNSRHTTRRSGANRNDNSHARGNASTGNGSRRSTSAPATASQVRALHAIANRQGLNLEAVVNDQYGVNEPESLTITQASEMIDELNGNHAAAMGGRR